MSRLSRLRALALSVPLAAGLTFGAIIMSPVSGIAHSSHAQATGFGDFLAAVYAENRSDLASASRYYDNALSVDPQNAGLMHKSLEMSVAIGDFDKALKTAKNLHGLDPTSDLANTVIAIDAFRTRSYRAVTRQDLEAMNDPVYYMVMKTMKAWSLHGLNRTDEALSLLQDNIRYNWEGWYVSYILSQLEDLRGNSKEALATFQPVYLAQQDVAEIAVTLALLHARNGEITAGEAILERYLANRSDIEVVSALRMLDVLAQKPIISSPQQALGLLMARLAHDLTAQREYMRALILVKLASAMGVQTEALAFQEAQILFSMERYEEALLAVQRVTPDGPVQQKALVLKAVAYNILERTDEAVSLLAISLEADYTNLEAIMLLGDLLRSEKDFKGAAKTYTRAIEQYVEGDLRFWRFFFNRGVAYERAGEWDLAEPDFIKALDMSPNHPKILNYLGYSWIDQGKNLEEALEMVERAVAISPTDGYIVDSLGWGFYKLGRYEEAVRYLERAVELQPVDPIINDHLGDAYWKVERFHEARFQWQRALEQEPEPELAAEIERKLLDGLVAEAAQ